MNGRLKNWHNGALLLLLALLACAAAAQAQDGPVEIEGFDLSVLDAKVADAAAKASASGQSSARAAAAAAYLERANVFYNAGRPVLYKLALGDLRRALRFQPDNAEARAKAEQITSIYQSMGRPVPANGEEGDRYNDPDARFQTKPSPINFPAGKPASTVLSENLRADVGYVYEFTAEAGRRVVAALTAKEGKAVLQIYKGRIEEASLVPSEETRWDGVIADAGQYLIKISPRDGPALYRLKVTVLADRSHSDRETHGFRNTHRRALRLRAGGLPRLPGDLARAATAAHASDVRDERHLGHLARRLHRHRGRGGQSRQ
jgi:hypothetical protein